MSEQPKVFSVPSLSGPILAGDPASGCDPWAAGSEDILDDCCSYCNDHCSIYCSTGFGIAVIVIAGPLPGTT